MLKELRIHQKHTLLSMFSLIILVVASALWNSYNIYYHSIDLVEKEADAIYNKDVAYRFWASSHGGVYVPVSEKTKPNPFLSHIPERDITTLSGKELTLMNPAYILRQTMEQFEELYGIKGHITSLKHFRPETAPDGWERVQLKRFEKGVKVAKEFSMINGAEYLRYMKPLIVQEGCLKCHAGQGYTVGDIRGGVSVSVPMGPYKKIAFTAITKILITHFVILVLFLVSFQSISRFYRRQIEKRHETELEKQKIEGEFWNEARKLQLTESHLHVANWRYDLKKDELTMSKEAYNIFGISSDKKISFEIFIHMVHPGDRSKIEKEFQQLLTEKKPRIMTWRYLTPDGLSKMIAVKGEVILDTKGEVVATAGLVSDISEKFFLREQFEKIYQLTDQGIVLYATFDGGSTFNIKDINPAAEKIDRIQREEVIGKDVVDIFPGIESFGLLDVMRKVFWTGKQIRTKTEKYQDERISGWRQNTVTRLSSNEILVVYTDKTTEYEQIEGLEETNRAIYETQEHLKTLLNTDPNIIVTTKEGKYLLSANTAFFDFFDYENMEAFKAAHHCICEFFEADTKQGYIQKEIDGQLWIEHIMANPDKRFKVKMRGSVFSVNVNKLPIKDARYIAVFSDITELEAYHLSLEQKIAEEQEKRRINEQVLIEQSKVAAMGEVMSSIAHHWRQPLNVIALQIQDALESYNEGEMTTEYFQETKKTIMNEVNFLTYTIDDFRNYFSKDQGNGEVHIKEVINHAISLIWAKADEGKTDIAFVGKDIIVQGRENEFKQVILNLLFNAIDSIKNKQQKETGLRGKIDIVAEEMNGSKQIMIRDNGIGINEMIKGRIFEPYFTTKFQSRGTGNGLYMSKIIIEHNMNGELLARNVCDTRNQNCGAEFVIRFDNKA